MNPSRKWVYWVGLLAAVLSLSIACWLLLIKQPAGWQVTWPLLAFIPATAIVQYATRILAPQKIQGFLFCLTTRQRLALYWLHYLALICFFASVVARLCSDFVPGFQSHRGFLQLLWIESIVLITCIADLSGTTDNVWRPQRPTPPSPPPSVP